MASTSSIDEILQQYPEEFLCLPSSDEAEEELEKGLSLWELINRSDADDDDDFDIDIDSFVSLHHSSLSSSIAVPPQTNQTQEGDTHFDTTTILDQDQQRHVAYLGYQYRDDEDDDDDDEEDDDMYDDGGGGGDGYDLDDELVPRSVSGKLGRQRMRKLGKRGFARMFSSKRSPFLYTKPGCVHGKHGLGLKHSC
ncbi:hypothetical protein Ddye_003981 [Dipteronia dyeriana]|uniref:Uncharacterized protein n=1 Tax=Dipteronia dyeriana TaxID=168575 RepID=A0AAD9XTT6_9ROSI|nr:hypothetical protein Ddye_003981 [Dipteronia dyeriana]